ncbi:hypothetical protein JCM1393_06340 [Clostridium carnis]
MNVIMFEYLRKNEVFQVGSHYYNKCFDKENDTVWISKPELFTNRDQESQGEIIPKVIAPMTNLPFFDSKFWAKRYCDFSSIEFNKKIRNTDWDILWLTNVKMLYYTKKLNYRYSIHRMADDFSGFPNAYKTMIDMEKEVVKNSDLVIVSAKTLIDKVYKDNKNVIYLPNGVDISRFEIEYEIPQEYIEINSPIVVYVGAIHEWFDFETISYAIERLKDCTFVFIGNENIKIKELSKKNNNVKLLGRKDHKLIPQYLKYANLGIMPFINNNLTNSIHPLKIYEYLAAGIPALSRELDETKNMNAPIYYYDSKESFVQQVKNIVGENHKKQEYIEYAANNTWEKRYIELMKYVQGELK